MWVNVDSAADWHVKFEMVADRLEQMREGAVHREGKKEHHGRVSIAGGRFAGAVA